jgi:regulatory protein
MKGWCDRQERCHREVVSKLNSWGYFGNQAQAMLSELISDNYVSEERFARAYCSGKFRMKFWGKQKIKANLMSKGISNHCLHLGMSEIDEAEYQQVMEKLIAQKLAEYKGLNDFQRRGKVAAFLNRKGFENEAIWRILKKDS